MDDDLFQFEAPAEAAPQLVLGKKKKKKKKKKEEDASVETAELKKVEHSSTRTIADENIEKDASAIAGDLSSPFAALGEGSDHADEGSNGLPSSAFAALDLEDNPDDSDTSPDVVLSAPVLSKKKKKKKKGAPLLDDLELAKPMQDADSMEPNGSENAISASEPAEARRPMTAAEKKKAKKDRERLAKLEKAKKEQNELDAILADLGDSKSAENTAAADAGGTAVELEDNVPMTAAQKKRTKKKKKAAGAKEGDVDEVDALLAELAPEQPKPAQDSAAQEEAQGVDDLLAELAGGSDAPATKKKAKKKKKKTAAKPDDDAGDNVAEDGAGSKKPKKKESAAVRKMREQREKMLAEEERLRKLREEEEARLAEEDRQREEEARQKEEERARKKAALKAKKERKRQDGTLLTKAEKERRRKAELFLQQMREQGRVPGALQQDSGPKNAQRAVYTRRKRNKPRAEGEPADDAPEVQTAAVLTEGAEKPIGNKGVEPEPAAPVIPEVIPDAWDEVPDDGTGKGDTANEEGNLPGKKSNAGSADESSENESDNETSEDSDDSEYDGLTKTEIASEKRRDALRKSFYQRKEEALAARSPDHLRSPIICILGHVDTGKTKILDRIRRTNVQDGEAGGITQQIGATYFPIDAVKKEATKLSEGKKLLYNVPSLLIIDTPGHESFTNLRSRGSSLCDIAILVIDIMHGLEPQTRESIDLLKLRKTPFVIALNKIDRIYDWDAQPHNCPTRASLDKQPRHAREEFMRRVEETKLQLAEIGFNTELYWENKDVRKTVSIVPTSAISGEGVPDLLMLLLALPQKLLTERLMYSSLLEATVLEVKVIEGLGTTIDIILTGGTIHEGDTLMVVGLDGPIITTIRALLTPHPMKELRVKGQYLHHKEIKAAQGVKISADKLEKAVAGTQVMVVDDPSDDVEMEYVREEVMKDFKSILTQVDRSGLGVYVQASTLGSLEALLEFLRTSKIPVSGINIGPVHKRDVTKASTMLEKRKEYATILAFDVTVEKEARELAEETGVMIFTADIIYHLFDQFTKYMEDVKRRRREEVNDDVVFPSISKILPQHIYNKKDPIIVGVDVMEGILRVGTPLVVRHGDSWLDIGRVASIELNKKQVITASKGDSVAVKIQHKNTEHIMYGRHFDFQDALVSKMSRPAIELLKESFRDDLGKEEWRLVIKLKKMLNIE